MRWLNPIKKRMLAARFEEVLLGASPWPYTLRRMRLFFVTSLVFAIVHCLRVWILHSSYYPSQLLALIAMEHIGFVIIATWWGALDRFRAHLGRLRHPSEKQRWIETWFRLSILFAALSMSAVVLFLWKSGHLEMPRKNIQVLTMWTLIAKLGLGIVLTFLHSCSFSYRRVYYPIVFILGSEILSIGLLFGLSFYVGPWALLWSTLATTIFQVASQTHYYLRSYRDLRLPSQALRLKQKDFFTGIRGVHHWRAIGLSSFFAFLARSPLFALYAIILSIRLPEFQSFLLYASPALHFFTSLPRSFYFDLRKYATYPWQLLRKKALLKILWVNIVIVSAGSAVFVLMGSIFLPVNVPIYFLLVVGPMMTGIGFFALAHLTHIQGRLQETIAINYPSSRHEELFFHQLKSRGQNQRLYRVQLPPGSKKLYKVKFLLLNTLANEGAVFIQSSTEIYFCEWLASPLTILDWLKVLGGFAQRLEFISSFKTDFPNREQWQAWGFLKTGTESNSALKFEREFKSTNHKELMKNISDCLNTGKNFSFNTKMYSLEFCDGNLAGVKQRHLGPAGSQKAS